MESINWDEKKRIAKGMTNAQLAGAIEDCTETMRVMGNSEMRGKDASYYADERSIYIAEQNRRTKGRTVVGQRSVMDFERFKRATERKWSKRMTVKHNGMTGWITAVGGSEKDRVFLEGVFTGFQLAGGTK